MNGKTVENVKPLDQFAEKVHGFVDRIQERVAGMEKVTGDCSATALSERALERALAKIERRMSRLESKMDSFQDYAEKNPMVASLIEFRTEALAGRAGKKRGTGAKREAKGTKGASTKKSRETGTGKAA